MRVLLIVLIASTAFAGAPKKKPAKKSPAALATEAEIKRTLDDAESKVGACVLDNAPPGPISLKVKAELMINSAGQLLAKTLTATPEGPANAKTTACIEKVLDGVSWPKSQAPVVNAEREWVFETQ